MITFNNIVSKFQEFCDNHHFIQTFSYGSPSDVDLEKFEQYPLLHLETMLLNVICVRS